jgi:DNA (cytosine-5)-methyltransferase 3A
MNVLSAFDGIACGRNALNLANIKVDKYYASEIDQYTIQIAMKNYPDIIQLGDINNINFSQFENIIDLLIGGSPCTFWSIGKRNREIDKNGIGWKLFSKYKDALQIIKPKYFLYENVASMPNTIKNFISEEFQCEPILINSALLSAQNRERLYWTNIPNIKQPTDKNIYLKDILLHEIPEDLIHSQKALEYMNRPIKDGRTHWDFGYIHNTKNKKSQCLISNLYKGVPYNVLVNDSIIRKLHPIECERLQTLPDDYTKGISNTQRYKAIGNGWTVDVIAHIFSYMNKI